MRTTLAGETIFGGDPTTEPDFEGLIGSFGRSLSAKNRPPKTQQAYVQTAQMFAAFCDANGYPASLAAIERAHVEEFISDQLDRWSPSIAAQRAEGHSLRTIADRLTAEAVPTVRGAAGTPRPSDP